MSTTPRNGRLKVFVMLISIAGVAAALAAGCVAPPGTTEQLAPPPDPRPTVSMAHTYTGDKTATRSPADPPVNRNPPKASVPDDGDPANAASVLQEIEVAMDYIAYEQAPFAKASDWGKEIKAFRNANDVRVAVADHLGMMGGRIFTVEEDWLSDTAGKSGAGSGDWFGRWKYIIASTGGNMQCKGAVPSALLRGPAVATELFDNGSNALTAFEAKLAWFADPIAVSYEFDVVVAATSGPAADTSYAVGLGDGTIVSGALTGTFNGSGPAPVGVAVYSNGAVGANWKAYVKVPAGSPVIANLGPTLALNAAHSIRIDILSATASDDGTARVLFFVDGNPTPAQNMAYDLTGAGLQPFQRLSGTTSVRTTFYTGRHRMRARLSATDVIF